MADVPHIVLAERVRIMIVLGFVMALDIGLRLPREKARPTLVIESAVLSELNRARTSPASFALSLQDQRTYYHGNLLTPPGGEAAFLTQEGVAPVDEAIAFVGGRRAEQSLLAAPVLTAAAADHQAEQSSSGDVGHVGSDGSMPSDRVRRRGGDIYVGELIAYGAADPAEIVRQLVVDDGVADRGHRRLLYDASLRYAGVSCGTHPVYRYMCVVTLGRTADGQPTRAGTPRAL